MKNYIKLFFLNSVILTGIIIITLSCITSPLKENKKKELEDNDSNDFKSYWYQGKSEINHYQLSQARYGELRDSNQAILVFVTENFLGDKQVKSDNQKEGLPILKLNYIKRFVTGIYDYSMMNSVFTPIDRVKFPNTLKLTSSSQDWCGQTFMQLNLRDNRYRVSSFSYFEQGGDESYSLNDAYLEDEIYALIRFSPENLPQGKIKMIPGTMQARLRHMRLAIEDVEASVGVVKGDEKINSYTLSYPKSDRVLRIFFEKEFPHRITGWEETYKEKFDDEIKLLTTKATLLKSVFTDYWKKNANKDNSWRDSLGLDKTY